MSDSLGFKIRKRIVNYKDIINQIVQNELLTNWKNQLFSYIQLISIDTQRLHVANGSISVSYVIKLDPRISKNTEIIFKLVDFINSTLYLNDLSIYSNISNNYSSIISYGLPMAQISSLFTL